jgi:O-antigen/teichoic acid export membrane protein
MKPTFSQSATVLAGRVIAGFSAIAINAIAARILSVEQFGVFLLISTIAVFLATVGQLGLNYTVVRVLAEDIARNMLGRLRRHLGDVIRLMTGGMILIGLVLLSAGERALDKTFGIAVEIQVIILLIVWIVGLGFQNVLAEAFRGCGRIFEATFLGGALSGLAAVLAIYVVWRHGLSVSLVGIMVIIGGSLIANCAISWYRLRRYLPPSVGHSEDGRHRVAALLRRTLPVLVSNIGIVVIYQSDVWLIGMFQNEQQVAVYGAASRLAGVLSLLIAIPHAVLPPLIAQRFVADDLVGLERLLRRSATTTGVLALPVWAVLTFASELVLEVVYGAPFREGHVVLQLIALGLLVNAVTGVRGVTLIMTGHEKVLTRITIVTGVINVLTCGTAAAFGNIHWVALASAASMTMQCIAEAVWVKKVLGVWPHFSVLTLLGRR